MTDKVTQLENQNDTLRTQLSQATAQSQVAQGKVAELSGAVKQAAQTSDQVTTLATQNDALRAQLSQLTSQYQTRRAVSAP